LFRNTIMAFEAVRGGSLFLLVQGGRLRRRLFDDTMAAGTLYPWLYPPKKSKWRNACVVRFVRPTSDLGATSSDVTGGGRLAACSRLIRAASTGRWKRKWRPDGRQGESFR